MDTSVTDGKARNMGLRVTAEPDAKAAAMNPTLATDTRTGSRRASEPRNGWDGTSGGAATATSAVAIGAGSRRGASTNASVICPPPAVR